MTEGTKSERRLRLKRAKKTAVLLTLILVFVTGLSMQALAAKKLTEVSITVSHDFKVGGHVSTNDVEVTTKSNRYSVSDIEIMNEIDDWGNSDTPVLEVTLEAEDGYYFSLVKSTIKVNGGTYISGTRKGTSSVTLKIQLPSLRGQVGELSRAYWSTQTVGSWSETYNVGYYELILYRDGKTTGEVQKATGTTFDFASMMTRPGTYSYRVRGVNAQDNSEKSDWREAEGSIYIDETAAAQYKNQYGSASSNASDPGEAASQKNGQYGWILDGNGWWYHNGNGNYTANDWQLIDVKWYFFDSRGYMVTGWIEWRGNSYYCMPETGNLLVNGMAPDGSGRRVDSTGAWVQ